MNLEWLEVRIVVQNECLSIKSRIEALDGDRQPLVNEKCFAAVTGDVADSSAEIIKMVCRLIHRAKRLHGDWKKSVCGRDFCILIALLGSSYSSATSPRPRAAAAM